jgi:hypothetical protein
LFSKAKAVPGSDETVSLRRAISLKRIARIQTASRPDEGIAMNTIVANVLMREAAKAQTDAQPFKVVAIFCGLGLLASFCVMSFGLDVGAGFF